MRRIQARRTLAAAMLLAAAPFVGGAREVQRYQNPVLDTDFPDPATLRAPDGYTYVYATQGQHEGAMHNIQVARSRDLASWERLGDALPVKPGWAATTQDFWAPHVHASGGRYYLYYSAKPDAAIADKTQGLCLAVATAMRPEGPFVDSGRPLQCGEGFVNIDPMAFDDPATGRALLYWGSGFGPIKVQELASDRVSFKAGSRPIDLLAVVKTDDPKNYRRLVEGAWVARRDGWYYLFFSGDNCCGPKAHYSVMVARSRRATGPFVGRGDTGETGSGVILGARGRWIAPGHNAVATDAAGQHWMLYHAVDARRSRTKPTDDVNSRRVMLLDRIVWQGGWPTIESGGPSAGPRAKPSAR